MTDEQITSLTRVYKIGIRFLNVTQEILDGKSAAGSQLSCLFTGLRVFRDDRTIWTYGNKMQPVLLHYLTLALTGGWRLFDGRAPLVPNPPRWKVECYRTIQTQQLKSCSFLKRYGDPRKRVDFMRLKRLRMLLSSPWYCTSAWDSRLRRSRRATLVATTVQFLRAPKTVASVPATSLKFGVLAEGCWRVALSIVRAFGRSATYARP